MISFTSNGRGVEQPVTVWFSGFLVGLYRWQCGWLCTRRVAHRAGIDRPFMTLAIHLRCPNESRQAFGVVRVTFRNWDRKALVDSKPTRSATRSIDSVDFSSNI